MRTKYIAVASGLLVAGAALAFAFSPSGVRAGESTTAEPGVVETDNCCLTGSCCCPGQGSCCGQAGRASAATSAVTYVKKAGAGCCTTGSCCCPGQGSCCGLTAAQDDGHSCCPSTAEKAGTCRTK